MYTPTIAAILIGLAMSTIPAASAEQKTKTEREISPITDPGSAKSNANADVTPASADLRASKKPSQITDPGTAASRAGPSAEK